MKFGVGLMVPAPAGIIGQRRCSDRLARRNRAVALGHFRLPLARATQACHMMLVKTIMPTPQEQYDEAMFRFSQADYDAAIQALTTLLAEHPDHFEAQLALGMAYYRKGDYPTAIREGHRAEQLRPKEQLVHTNLSLFYMKAGDKQTAEHHGLQARIAGWRENMAPPESAAGPGGASGGDPELQIAQPKPPPVKAGPPPRDMPWKKKPPGHA
jgi:Flp pilus assembly protein TadD